MEITINSEKLTFEINIYDNDKNTKWYILKGKKGAVVLRESRILTFLSLDYHAIKQQYKGQKPLENCEFIGQSCYGDGRTISNKKIGEFDLLEFLYIEYESLI